MPSTYVRANASFHEIVVSTYVVYMLLNVYTVYMVDYIHTSYFFKYIVLSWLKNYPLPVVNKSLCKVLRSLSDPDG